MTPNRSLAEERQALLAKMEASRVAYRHMLQGTDRPQTTTETVVTRHAFPRSHTVRWIRDHPYLSAVAAMALVLASRRAPRQTVQRVVHRGNVATSAVMRNQNKIRIALGIATAVARFVGRLRQR